MTTTTHSHKHWTDEGGHVKAAEDVLAFSAFPSEHWRKIWSTYPLDRLNKEIKRCTRVVSIFPNDASIVRLVGALLLEQQEE